jgi:hypothetical protein
LGGQRGGEVQRGIEAGQGGHLVGRADQVPLALEVQVAGLRCQPQLAQSLLGHRPRQTGWCYFI